MPSYADPLSLPTLKARLTDAQALTFTLYGEARDEPIEAKIAVGCVVRNRLHEGRKGWGDKIVSVCLAPNQFACWHAWGGQANYDHLLGLVSVLLNGGPAPWSDAERDLYTECCWITEGILSGFVLDRVRGATHYYAPEAIPGGSLPDWARGQEPLARVGRFVFHKGLR